MNLMQLGKIKLTPRRVELQDRLRRRHGRDVECYAWMIAQIVGRSAAWKAFREGDAIGYCTAKV